MTALTFDSLLPDSEQLLSSKTIDDITQDPLGDRAVSAATLALLRSEGYFGLAVPHAFEGRGASLAQSSAVQMRLAAANLGLTIGLNMHLFTVGVIREHWQRKQDKSWALLEAIATQNRIVASAFAEPRLGGSILRSNSTGRKVARGYTVNGVKSPCSLAARSDLICLQFQSDEPRADSLLVALIPTATEGVRIEKTWKPSGLEASESDTVQLRDCFVPDELVFHRTPPGEDCEDTFAAGLVWFCVLTTVAYIGAAKSALEHAASAMRRSEIPPEGKVRASVPTLQAALGDLLAPVLTLEAACCGLANAYDQGRSPSECLTWAMALKCNSVAACTSAVSGAMELCGVTAFNADSTLVRINRDMQAIHFHPPTRFVARRGLANAVLGNARTFDLLDAAIAN